MNVILTTFLTNYKYPFFNCYQKPELDGYFNDWYKSVLKSGLNAVILIDEPNEDAIRKFTTSKIKFVVVETKGVNQLDYRWELYYNYLLENTQIDAFFTMDISDSTILKDPFGFINECSIYIGDELSTLSNSWIERRVNLINNVACTEMYSKIKDKQLLNCGLLGGYRETLLPLLYDVRQKLNEYNCKTDTIDMVVFNELLYSKYYSKVCHGMPVNTKFWKWEFGNEFCWFQHK
jgi:hypothetical protein